MIMTPKTILIRKMASLLGVAIFISFSPACTEINNVEYSKFYDFGNKGWSPDECLEYMPWPGDSVVDGGRRYDLVLCLRYSAKCKLSRLPIRMEQVSLSMSPDTTLLEIPLITEAGYRRGKGSYTIYEISDTIARNIALSDGYTVTLFNSLDAVATEGITNIGIILSSSN